MQNTTGVKLEQPVSVLARPLKLEYKDFFVALGKGVARMLASSTPLSWSAVVGDVFDAIKAIQLKSLPPEQLAWQLIRQAMGRAVLELVEEEVAAGRMNKTRSDGFSGQIGAALERNRFMIDKDFFQNPKEVPLVGIIQRALPVWLRGFGLSPIQAQGVVKRLPGGFVLALLDEWRARPGEYVLLFDYLNTPFTDAGERELGWQRYQTWLQHEADQPMFDEAFGLREVYIPLRGFWVECVQEEVGDNQKPVHDRHVREVKHLCRLHDEMDAWLARGDADDALRVICGGPGCGKSSFAKMWVSAIAQRGEVPVLLIPLHRINPRGDLLREIADFIQDDPYLKHNPMEADPGKDRLLLVFDGLDELAMQGKAALDTAKDFVSRVNNKLANRNHGGKLRLQVVLTGRDIVIQGLMGPVLGERDRQVLHVLEYRIPEEKREEIVGDEDELNEDQRQTWWQKYGVATGQNFESMPDELDQGPLQAVTAQPLLNYLVALARVRHGVDFTTENNVNAVYAYLLEAAYERRWGPGRPGWQGVSLEQFSRFMEEAGVASWHGSGQGRVATVDSVRVRLDKKLLKILEELERNQDKGVDRLLMAFYFRHGQRSADGEKTFEFTHKSFGEYLTARRIVGVVRLMAEQIGVFDNNSDAGWDDRKALVRWAEVCGPTALDFYLLAFLRQEVALHGQEVAVAWQGVLVRLVNYLLRHGLPMEDVKGVKSYQEMDRQARNAEEALLAALDACARVSEQPSQVDWPDRTTLGTWLKRLQGQRVVTTLSDGGSWFVVEATHRK